MKTLILGILFFLLISEVFMAPFEKHGFSHGSKKTSRRSNGSSHRDKRACTWWFEWRVSGADVNNAYVTGLLNRDICAWSMVVDHSDTGLIVWSTTPYKNVGMWPENMVSDKRPGQTNSHIYPNSSKVCVRNSVDRTR